MNRELESSDFLRAGMKRNPCGLSCRYNQVEVLKSKKAGEIFFNLCSYIMLTLS